jgi:hypothetical protein
MRRWGGLVPALLVGVLVGCVTGPPARTNWLGRLRPGTAGAGPETVQLFVATLEVPVGDTFANQDLWGFTDEQVVGLENKEALEVNGFRVGQVVGSLPRGLQVLLTSKRSCPDDPRLRQPRPGDAVQLPVGPVRPHGRFLVAQDGQPLEVALDQVAYGLVVEPTLTADGRTHLRFTPQVEHGEPLPDFRAASDCSGFVMEVHKPHRTYPAAAWEVTIGPSDCLLLGACFDRPESLGYQTFVQSEGPAPVQRLLVVRVNCSGADLDFQAEAEEGKSTSYRMPPLALQATWSTARGSAP